jgi:signal peptidase II|tara:strand:+ start:27 stop:530 length:504 start_codon:yes stop_codon:yes gene_type:complete
MMMNTIAVRLRGRISFNRTAILAITLDQVSKLMVRIYIPFGSSMPENGFFRFTYIKNTGALFGLFKGHMPLLITMSFVGMVAVLLCYFLFAYKWRSASIGLGLILGGAIGNQIDRLWRGHVTDFIDWGSWPVFNIADSSGVIGVAVIVFFLLFLYREKEDSSSKQDE